MEVPTADGGQIWAEMMGDGEPVVLISGMSQDHTALATQFELADEFRLVCPDKRGTGRSSDWDADPDRGIDPPAIGNFVDDILTVLKHLGLKKVHVVGFSMGGRIAQWVAIRFPKRVASLVLIATSPGENYGVPRTPETDRLMETGTPAQTALLNYSSTWMAAHPDLVERLHASTTERGQQRRWHFLATHGHDSWNSLPHVAAPTLVIHGTDDKINPIANSYLLQERIPSAELMVIEGGRHACATEYADDVNARIRAHLRAHPIG